MTPLSLMLTLSEERPAMAGVTTADILKAANWNSESVFQRFHFRSKDDPSYGRAVRKHNDSLYIIKYASYILAITTQPVECTEKFESPHVPIQCTEH